MSSFHLLRPPVLPKAPTLPNVTRKGARKPAGRGRGRGKDTAKSRRATGAKKNPAPRKKRATRTRSKPKIPPYEPGEVFAGIGPQGGTSTYEERPSLIRTSKRCPPSGSVFWYKLQWKTHCLLPVPLTSSSLYVAYKEQPQSMVNLKEHFQMPIRWSAFNAKQHMVILDNGQGGLDYFWYRPTCIIQWSDATASHIQAIHFAIINKNWSKDYAPPLWEPVVDVAHWLEAMFPGHYQGLPPCHPDKEIALKTTACEYIPQRTPAWEELRELGMEEGKKKAGSTAITNIFDFYNDQGTVQTRPNVLMLIGTQGEEYVICYWLSGRHRVHIQEIGWTKHPTKGQTRGSSADGLIEDPSIHPSAVPNDIVTKARKAGHNIKLIDWKLGCVEMKFSEQSENFSAYYFPQCLNHAICTQRWYTDLGKFCTRTGRLLIWRLWRDAEIEAILEGICEDERIWSAPGNYVKEVCEGKTVTDLRNHWKREAARLNAIGPDWVISGPEAMRMVEQCKAEEQRWFIATHGSTPVRQLSSENASDRELADIWIHGIECESSIQDLSKLRETAAETLFPHATRSWTASEEQVDTIQQISIVLRKIASDLQTQAAYLDEQVSKGS